MNMLGKKESKWESLTQKLQQNLVEDRERGEEEENDKGHGGEAARPLEPKGQPGSVRLHLRAVC